MRAPTPEECRACSRGDGRGCWAYVWVDRGDWGPLPRGYAHATFCHGASYRPNLRERCRRACTYVHGLFSRT